MTTPTLREALRGQKYGARRCNCGRHASLKEHRRWQELTLLERAGEIRNLREQVAFELAPAVMLFGRKKPALRYVADFVYEEHRDVIACPWRDGHLPRTTDPGDHFRTVIEDAKGMQTPAFRIKAHLMAAQGREVRLS